MPEKNIREMSVFERRHYSLAARVFRVSLFSCLVMGLSALILGIGLYMFMLQKQYVSEGYNLAKNAVAMLKEITNAQSYADRVMEIYHGMSEEERAQMGSNEYYSKFAAITFEREYQQILRVLDTFRLNSDIDDMYLAVYDDETKAIIYVADPDNRVETACPIGTWESVKESEIKAFLKGKKNQMPSYISNKPRYGPLVTSGVYLRSKMTTYGAFVLADVTMQDVMKGMEGFAMIFSGTLLLMTLLLAFFTSRNMSKTLVAPINRITNAAQAYVQDRKAGIRETDHFGALNIRTGDEVENLSLVMADMEQDLAEYEEHLTAVTSEKERIDAELSLATRIQTDMLPNIYPPFPERKEFDIFAAMRPAKEVGGDFYDYYLVDDDHLALLIADVSGKGVPAALFMMVSKIVLQNYTMMGLSPGRVLEEVNQQICQNNREEMFVTVWLGVLELSTGRLVAANAGHEYPALCRPGGKFELFRDRHGFVVGGMEQMKYKDYEILLEPGSWLFVYTDGVAEAENEGHQLFGTQRMLETLGSGDAQDAKRLVEKVGRTIEIYSGDAPQFDDITMLALHFFGKGAQKEKQTMTVDAVPEQIEPITDFINDKLMEAGCPMKTQMQIDVAVDEILANIVSYAYAPHVGPVTVTVEIPEEGREVILTFSDHGMPYDPTKNEDPDVTLSAEDREIGGLGIYLVKKTMDDVKYEYRVGSNVLTIRKKW
ncbi:MAG: SpoIIE family protein phosphatase [Lachnospiraceae bacterium]|nr:SpoIIE family protein phosphatase [Lachnospiraceae bacterium]